MKIFKSILQFLSGKKGAIASIIGMIVTYYVATGGIDLRLAELIMGISAVVFGGVSYATGKLVYNGKK